MPKGSPRIVLVHILNSIAILFTEFTELNFSLVQEIEYFELGQHWKNANIKWCYWNVPPQIVGFNLQIITDLWY